MKKEDISFIENELKNDYLLNNYLTLTKVDKQHIKIMFNAKVVTLFELSTLNKMVSWYCDGSITSGEANHLEKLCKTYNDR